MSSERKPFPQDTAGKIEMAKELKDEGNQHFKDQNFKKAITTYSKALAFTKGLPGRKQGLEGVSQMALENSRETMSADTESALNELDTVLKTNIATCYIKLNNSEMALQYCKEALVLSPNAWKTLMRKAEAIILMNDFERAISVLDESLRNTQPTDEAARTSIAKVRERAVKLDKQATEKQRKAFGNIFERARVEAANDKKKPVATAPASSSAAPSVDMNKID